MPRVSRSRRRAIAILVWALGMVLFFGLAFWNVQNCRRDTENRLISESARMAGQTAAMLASFGDDLDEAKIRAAITAVMDDDNVYAIKVDTKKGLQEGQRRNYLWEPVPWDDEIAENSVQGMNPIKIDGQNAGIVEIWISPRLGAEEEGLLAEREKFRFTLLALLWTITFLLIFWDWGELRRLRGALRRKDAAAPRHSAENIVLGMKQDEPQDGAGEAAPQNCVSVVDADAGRRFQRRNPDSWRVTAGMFRQTFARGPALISRLYAEGEMAGLCHLGRMLEQAAPCIGADRLAIAARQMQAALNDPDCQARAMPVEQCAAALEEVLEALCGNGQWHSKVDCAGS